MPSTTELIEKNDLLKKLQTFGSSFVLGKCHFEDDGAQNYLVFQPDFMYFKSTTNSGFKSYGKET